MEERLNKLINNLLYALEYSPHKVEYHKQILLQYVKDNDIDFELISITKKV